MKDRIGNKLALRDKVLVALPTSDIVGFIAELKECGMVALRQGQKAGATPGHVLVSCVISVPVDPEYDATAQLVKVYDADKAHGPSLVAAGSAEPSQAN
jgi:hypothetical protein